MSNSVVQDEQTSVELHQLPESWTWSRLGDLGLVRLGKTPRKSDYRDHGDYKIIKFRDVDDSGKIDWDNNEKGYVNSSPGLLGTLQELRDGDVLVTASAHMSEHIGKKVGIVLSIPRKYKKTFVVGELLQIRTKEAVAPRWVFYFLGSAEGYKAIQRRVHGVHLIGSRAQHIEVPLAPLDQQQTIVEEIEKQFSRLDEAVTNLKRVKASLKRYKAAVLKSAIEGCLVPTEAELCRHAGRSFETAAQLLKTNEQQFSPKPTKRRAGRLWGSGHVPQLTPDELSKLPEGWTWAKVRQVGASPEDAVQVGPMSMRSEDFKETGVPVLNVGCVQWGRFDETKLNFLPENIAEDFSRYRIQPGDVMFTRSGTVGRCAVAKSHQRNWLMTFHLLRARPNPKCCLPEYLRVAFEGAAHIRRQTKEGSIGTTRAGFNTNLLANLDVPLPPLAEQHRIVAEVERSLSVVEELETAVDANLTRAERLRQSILHGAFSGSL